MNNNSSEKLVAVFTNHDDDIYCFRKELIERLYLNGYKILISCPYGEKLELIKDIKFEYIDCNIDRRGTNIIKDFKLFIHYNQIIRKYKPDVILTYTIKPNIYASIAASLNRVSYINNITGLGSIQKKTGLIKKLIMHLFKIAFRKSSCIFFQNKENMDFVIKSNIVRGEYQLIPGSGVNTDRFSLKDYPEYSDKLIFNYIGRVLKDKGIDDYIEAAKIIKSKDRGLDIEFNIIGFIEPTEKEYRIILDELQRKNIIIYRGSQTDVRDFISKSNCTIHPSTYGEGMSNVLLETASSGRPIITTDIAGCKETVDDGISGYIYKAGSVSELVMKIEKFIKLNNDERKTMGIKGREKMIKQFSREFVIEKYILKIKELI